MKKHRIIKIFVIIVCLALCWFIARQVINRNVFDEMYYGHYSFKNYHMTESSYRGTRLAYTPKAISMEFPGFIFETYPDNLVDDNCLVDLEWNTKQQTLDIKVVLIQEWDVWSELLAFSFQYEVKNKRLLYLPVRVHSSTYKEEGKMYVVDPVLVNQYMQEYDITREDIENISKLVLYDKILSDWFEANRGKTRYSMEDLGDLEIINNQFPDQ